MRPMCQPPTPSIGTATPVRPSVRFGSSLPSRSLSSAAGSATVAADRLASDLRNSRLSIICTPPGILQLFDFDRTAGTPSSVDETVRDVRKPPITADARRLGWDTDEHGAAPGPQPRSAWRFFAVNEAHLPSPQRR